MKTGKALIGIIATIFATAQVGCDLTIDPESPGGAGDTAGSEGSGGGGSATGTGEGDDSDPIGVGGSYGDGAGGADSSGSGAGSADSSGSGAGGADSSGSGGNPGMTGSGAGGPGQAMDVPGVEVTLKSGEKVVGQLIHEYDHSIWWFNASNEKTYAVFDSSKFDLQNDQSFRFLSSKDVVSMQDVVLPPGTVPYSEVLRQNGIYVQVFPVGGGPLYVAAGNDGHHLQENGNGDFAWDLVRTTPNGKSYTGTGKKNTEYLIWDSPVVLPIGGEVIHVIRDEPDNAVPGQYSYMAQQNMIGVDVGGNFSIWLLHLRQGSIPASVKPGAKLEAGTVVGNVGNSGISIEPHLHLAMVWQPPGGQMIWGVPLEWGGMWSSSSSSGPSQKSDFLTPQTGTWVSDSMF